ncbi:MAG: type II 3-dehydroquinate dehydratase [Alphaproteobacteria bacterium]|nr:type II 3-dehydroquinate dehydratase [Alphaproteobacteria bacterium]
MNILLLNGPNLNMLGKRDASIYGTETLKDVEDMCQNFADKNSVSLTCRQSNHEGELVTWIQQARGAYDAIIINGGAYTHTSIAIHDALEIFDGKVVEIHISEPKKRETFRHISYIEPCADYRIAGDGVKGYIMALEWAVDKK